MELNEYNSNEQMKLSQIVGSDCMMEFFFLRSGVIRVFIPEICDVKGIFRKRVVFVRESNNFSN